MIRQSVSPIGPGARWRMGALPCGARGLPASTHDPGARAAGPRSEEATRFRLSPVLFWMFLFSAFVFSMGMETIDVGLAADHIYVSRIIGYLFMLTTLCQPKICFRRPPAVFWCFVTYLCIYTILGGLQDTDLQVAIFARLFTLVQMLVLFWIASNLMRYETIDRGAISALAASCVLLAALQVTGLASTSFEDGRTSALGQDPNWLASAYSLGILALIGLAYRPNGGSILGRVVVWPLCVLLGVAIVMTGSRGGFLCVATGLLALVPGPGSFWSRVRTALIVLLAIGALGWYSSQCVTTRARWEGTLAAGDMAGRERIYPAAWRMFLEKPLAGWGPATHCSELGRRTNKSEDVCKTGRPYREAHNLFLWVLIECGLLGAIPFFTGIWLCLRAAWSARAGAQGGLPLAMMVTLLAANLSTTQMGVKLDWLIFAYAAASATHAVPIRTRRRARRPARPAVRPGAAARSWIPELP